MVMAALDMLGMALPDWAALYSDVPSRQLKASRLLRHTLPLAYVNPRGTLPDGGMRLYRVGRIGCRANLMMSLSGQVKVSDRNAITTADAETRVVTPAALQPQIDAAIAKYPAGAL